MLLINNAETCKFKSSPESFKFNLIQLHSSNVCDYLDYFPIMLHLEIVTFIDFLSIA